MQKEQFYSLLDEAITSSNRGDILIIMGDFNAQKGSDNQDVEGIKDVHDITIVQSIVWAIGYIKANCFHISTIACWV